MKIKKTQNVFILMAMICTFALSFAQRPGEGGGGIQKLDKFKNIKVINNLDHTVEIFLNEGAKTERGEKKVSGIVVKSKGEQARNIEESIIEKMRMVLKDAQNKQLADSGNVIISWANARSGRIQDILKGKLEAKGIDVNLKGEGDTLQIVIQRAGA